MDYYLFEKYKEAIFEIIDYWIAVDFVNKDDLLNSIYKAMEGEIGDGFCFDGYFFDKDGDIISVDCELYEGEDCLDKEDLLDSMKKIDLDNKWNKDNLNNLKDHNDIFEEVINKILNQHFNASEGGQ